MSVSDYIQRAWVQTRWKPFTRYELWLGSGDKLTLRLESLDPAAAYPGYEGAGWQWWLFDDCIDERNVIVTGYLISCPDWSAKQGALGRAMDKLTDLQNRLQQAAEKLKGLKK